MSPECAIFIHSVHGKVIPKRPSALEIQSAPREQRRTHSEKPLPTKVFWRVHLVLCPLEVCSQLDTCEKLRMPVSPPVWCTPRSSPTTSEEKNGHRAAQCHISNPQGSTLENTSTATRWGESPRSHPRKACALPSRSQAGTYKQDSGDAHAKLGIRYPSLDEILPG